MMRRISMPLLSLALLGAFSAGCSSQPKAPPTPATIKTLRLTQQLGGAHHRALVHDGIWYQTFDRTLLVLDQDSGAAVREIELGKAGACGPAIDVAAVGRQLYVVIEDDAVVELLIDIPGLPKIVRHIDANTLGIRPRRLSVAEGVVYVSGPGGVVRLPDLTRMMTRAADENVGRVVMSDCGLVATIGRRVYRLEDGAYVGAASELVPLPDDFGIPGGLAFALQSENGALIGLMTPNLREVNSELTTVALPGQVRTIRADRGRLWVATDQLLAGYVLSNGELQQFTQSEILGVHDVSVIEHNYLAVAGSFGRAVYRVEQDESGPGNTYLHVHREPSRLSAAACDGRYVLAGSDEGMWLYLINSRVEPTERTLERAPVPPQSASTVNANAQIDADRRSVKVTSGGRSWTYTEPAGCIMHCVAAIDGQFWIGHDRGITVLRPDGGVAAAMTEQTTEHGAKPAAAPDPVAGRLRFQGPVLHIYPLLVGGGASFVSELGGFGVAKFVEEPASAAAAQHR